MLESAAIVTGASQGIGHQEDCGRDRIRRRRTAELRARFALIRGRSVKHYRHGRTGGMALKLHGARGLTISAWDAVKAPEAALDPKRGFAAVAAINAAIIALAKAFAEQGIPRSFRAPGPSMEERSAMVNRRRLPA